MPEDSPLPALCLVCKRLGYPLSPNQIEAFRRFGEALEQWNQVKNLTRVPVEEFEARHFAESCLILDLIPHGASVLDIGTGPGFPAWPIACVRPDCHVSALDSNGKMLDFLRAHPLPNLSPVQGRMEEQTWIEEFDFVTGRAVAPLPLQLELSARACRVGGLIVPFRSPGEIVEGPMLQSLNLRMEDCRTESVPDGRPTLFPIYRKFGPTPPQFPRPWARMKARPLE